MVEVTIRNKEFLSKLNNFVDEYFAIDGYNDPNNMQYSSRQALDDPEYFCSVDYLKYMLSIGDEHSGFPEEHMAMPISSSVRNNPEKFTAYKDMVKHEFAQEIGAHTSALLNYYPPGGFVGWHTNWNANAYQILFTWSKTGDGYFRYRDPETHELVTIKDKPGWQCRHYYFGRKDEPDHHCWHAAYAGCDRITLAYKFVNVSKDDPQDQMAVIMRDQLIEEIETE